MDHSEASRLMASEKYLLDGLSPTEMEEFEEHLFGCHDCAMDVRAGSVFLEQAKVELARSPSNVRHVPAEDRPSRGFSWWRAAFAIPAMAILLIVVGYQNLVTFPALKGALAENRAPRILPAAALVSSATRGVEPTAIEVRPSEPFLLPLDIQPQNSYESYVIELQNPAGVVQWSLPVSSELVKNTLTIAAPGVDKDGRYEVIVLGRNGHGQNSEIGRYPFDLRFASKANPEP
ncbi:MAG: zf-HC2 domain-containing protein [Candidatus Sulfotelmatobacter sp.]